MMDLAPADTTVPETTTPATTTPATTAPATIAAELLALTERTRDHTEEDPFGNPVLGVALAVTRRVETGGLDMEDLEALVRYLRDDAFRDRCRRLARYVGGTDPGPNEQALAELSARLVRPDPMDSPVPFRAFRDSVERTRFAAVFTAHPTFALPHKVEMAMAEAASGRAGDAEFESHRPSPPTLEDEFERARVAIVNGRDALDRLTAALLAAAKGCWPDRWAEQTPRPLILSTWVGYDTDGRTDINWWDTLRLRLRMKRLQLLRLREQVGGIIEAEALRKRLDDAIGMVEQQLEACPDKVDPEAIAEFARLMVEGRETAAHTVETLLPLFETAIARAEGQAKMTLCVARAGLVSHGLSLAHTHFRLNSAQLHNVVRQRLNITDSPEDPSRRRTVLAAINAALDAVEAQKIDFGTLIAEQASAARLMITIAQVIKLIDGSTPIRFLIAETESGYTLLSALWLARLLGIEEKIEISPLFETADALEQGGRVIEEALRSPHYRAYLQKTGRLAVQFGYSDSGRYVGQLAATYLIERLRIKIVDALKRHKLTNVELILFDTHGESVGRGAHPGSLAARLDYLSPPEARHVMAEAGVHAREESAFQGGDGYLFFGTPEMALATITRIAEHAFRPRGPSNDPIYAEPDFASDFFASIRNGMEGLVEDPGYAALLGAFGPALLDKTGSRPSARETDGMGGPPIVKHPRELRAIPNNAILQQFGWMANTLQGLGTAAARNPELFGELFETSRRFRTALDLALHARSHSDLDVLRAIIATMDPASWLDRAAHERQSERRQGLVAVARGLERLDLWAAVQSMFRRIQLDALALQATWPSTASMSTREILLHALRIAIIHRIWMLATLIPDFSPRHGVTRQALEARILRLEITQSLKLLGEVFPLANDPAADRDYAEPRGMRANAAYRREHEMIFEPIGRLYGLVREISTAVTHEVGAFG